MKQPNNFILDFLKLFVLNKNSSKINGNIPFQTCKESSYSSFPANKTMPILWELFL